MLCVSDNGATAPISALTYEFSIGPIRVLRSDDFSPRIIVRLDRSEQDSHRVRQEVNLIRTGIDHAAYEGRTSIDPVPHLSRSVLGKDEHNSFRPDQFANGRCTGFDDSSVEVTA